MPEGQVPDPHVEIASHDCSVGEPCRVGSPPPEEKVATIGSHAKAVAKRNAGVAMLGLQCERTTIGRLSSRVLAKELR